MSLVKVQLEHSEEHLYAHPKGECQGQFCTLHNRSAHILRSFRQHWRDDRGIMERICTHGVGHPDPDDLNGNGLHGCDGCCRAAGDSTQGASLAEPAEPVVQPEPVIQARDIEDQAAWKKAMERVQQRQRENRCVVVIEAGCVVEAYGSDPDMEVDVIDLDQLEDNDLTNLIEAAQKDLNEEVEAGTLFLLR